MTSDMTTIFRINDVLTALAWQVGANRHFTDDELDDVLNELTHHVAVALRVRAEDER